MITKLFVTSDLELIKNKILEILQDNSLTTTHPDVLYIDSEQKLGIEQARRIKDHFLLKPYQAKGRAVVVEDLAGITVDAQNALLKVIEEPPEEAIILFGTANSNHLLPTFLSRCLVLELDGGNKEIKDFKEIEVLLSKDIPERFKSVEKADDKEKLLSNLLYFTHQELIKKPEFVQFAKKTLEMERFQKAHVNLRGILEYLMLILPKK
jgi:DNA polymerase III delta prime subunit